MVEHMALTPQNACKRNGVDTKRRSVRIKRWRICFGSEHARHVMPGLEIWTGLISHEIGVS